jgi:hypothetical protein
MDVTHVALYGAQPLGRFTLTAMLGYGYAADTTTRVTGSGAAGGRNGTDILSAGAQASTRLTAHGFVLQPAAGISAVRLTGAHMAERGSGLLAAFAVHGEMPGITSVQPYITLPVSRVYLTASQLTVIPTVAAGYVLEAANRGRSATVFSADGTAFATPHNNLDASGATLSAGLSASRANWVLFARYQATLAGNWTAQTLDGGVKLSF